MKAIFQKSRSLARDIYLSQISNLPGAIGFWLRYRFWKKRLRKLGRGALIDTGVYFQNPDFIEIGDNCWIDKNVMIMAGRDESKREKITRRLEAISVEPGVVHIGANVHIGAGTIMSGISAGVHISDDCTLSVGCRVFAFSHHYCSRKDPSNMNVAFGSMVPHDRQCIVEGPIFVGRNTGVALNAVMLPGVFIAGNCFVAVNSVVHRGSYEDNSIISGNPAKVIRRRFKPAG